MTLTSRAMAWGVTVHPLNNLFRRARRAQVAALGPRAALVHGEGTVSVWRAEPRGAALELH
jgi:hypothetical protein